MDLMGIPGPRVKRLRYVTLEQWFPEQRDVGVDRRFYTLLQESFDHTYCQLDIKISEHKMLHWVAMRVEQVGLQYFLFLRDMLDCLLYSVRGPGTFESGCEFSTPLCLLRRTDSL